MNTFARWPLPADQHLGASPGGVPSRAAYVFRGVPSPVRARAPARCAPRRLRMGALHEDQLFISPFMSLIVVLIVMLLMQVGSNYFARMQQVPSHTWPVLDIFRGDLFDRNARTALLTADSKAQGSGSSSLGGLRTLVAMSCDLDISVQQRVASSLVTLLELAQSGMAQLPVEQLAALVSLSARFTPSARAHAALGLANVALCPEQREALSAAGLLGGALKHLVS